MCGICGIASARGAVDPDRARRDERDARPPRARLRRRVRRRARSASPRGGSRSSTSPRATSRSRTRTAGSRSSRTARSTTTASSGTSSSAPGTRSRRAATPRCSCTSTRSTGSGSPTGCAGMFAVAIWDSERGRLVLARDRYGIKPLYYREADGELAFASELRALPRGEIDLDALDAFLAFNSVPGPLTIFREVRKLQPGHVLTWEDGRTELIRYARPAPVAADEVRGDEEAELVEELRARLRDSVRAHLVSDVPVGVLLSGGVDSSMLAALAAEEVTEPLRTFSIGFEERSFDELADARLVAERYGTEHRELVLRPDAALLLPALADAFDEPFADSSALPTYLVSRLAAEDVKVALSGEGGDELFGGYYTYAADLLAERAGWTAPLLRPFVERLPSSSARASFDYKAKRFVRAAHLPAARAPPRLEGDLLARCARRAHREIERIRPGRPAPRPFRRDGRRGAARAAPGRRSRHLPRRRPAREDRPRVDGPFARGSGAVPRPDGDELRLLAPEPAQGSRAAQEGAPAQGGRAARPARAAASAASAASRFPRRPGCGASSSRSRARPSRPTRCAARASSARTS